MVKICVVSFEFEMVVNLVVDLVVDLPGLCVLNNASQKKPTFVHRQIHRQIHNQAHRNFHARDDNYS